MSDNIFDSIKAAQASVYESQTTTFSSIDGKFVGNILNTVAANGTSIPDIRDGDVNNIVYNSPTSMKPLIEKIKASYGYTSNPNTAKMLEREYINRFNVNLIDNVLGHMRCYVFIGKPTCALVEEKFGTLGTTTSVKNKGNLNQLLETDLPLYKFLNGHIKGNSPFITPLQNRLIGLSVQDATLSTSMSAANTRGITQGYAMSYAESLANVPITLTFAMDRNAEVIKLINAWVAYIEGVKEGTIQQAPEDAARNRMSYTCPIWLFACEEDASTIIFWAKLVGNFPTSIPFSIFGNQGPINTETRDLSVSFSSSIFRPFDINGLAEFNSLSSTISPKYYLDTFTHYHNRNLFHYWVNGAEVVRDTTSGKFKLVHFTTQNNKQEEK